MRSTLLTLVANAVLLLAIATGVASHWNGHEYERWLDAPALPTSPNLLDVLVQSPNHTIFVRLLQRTRLVPTLINLMEFGDGRGLTIMAPTDASILKKKEVARMERLKDIRANYEAEYIDDGHARSLWEWAVYLAERDDGPGDDDLVVPLWAESTARLGNVNAVLRQQLLYHMVNFTLPSKLSGEEFAHIKGAGPLLVGSTGNVTMIETLHRPSRRLLHEPTRPGPVPHPPSLPPHPGAEDGGGLLAGEGQKVRFATKESGEVWVGASFNGSGGVKVVKTDRSSDKGVVFSLDGILELPPSLDTLLKTHPSLQHLRNLTSTTLLASLTETAHTTFFLPTEKAFEVLSAIEKTFITGDWALARQDRLKLLGEHMSGIGLGGGRVGYAARLRKKGTVDLTTIFGGQVRIESEPDGKILVAKGKVIEEDLLTENGVVHVIDCLLLPYGDLGLSVEKTLLALNASRFVSLMRTAGLESYIDANPHDNDDPGNEAQPWTFMVPRDDVIEGWWRDQGESGDYAWSKWGLEVEEAGHPFKTPKVNGTKLVELLKYHVAPRQLTPQNLTDGMLIGTELRDWKLKDARQKVIVDVEDGSSAGKDRQGNGDVGFGDANVIAKPVTVGPSIIYLISKILETPANPLQTAVSSLSLSTFVATVFSAELDKGFKRAPAVTYLVPHNEAFAALGLAMPYLLLDQTRPRAELRSMVEYHAIDEIVYMKDFATGSKRYPTLEQSPIWAGRDENGTVEIKRGTLGRNARVLKGDFLTSTGVLHEIDQVELPPTLDLTIEKLMKGAKADTMKDLIQLAGYGWILNASAPTWEQVTELETLGKFPHKRKHQRKERKRHQRRHDMYSDFNQSYVVLCPTDAAFTRVNLTHYYEDLAALKALVQLHIIPSPADQVLPDGKANQLPLSIKDSSSFSTLLDASVGGVSRFGKLAFRKVHKEDAEAVTGERGLGWVVGVADTRGTDGRKYSANVVSFGRESLSIDRSTTIKASETDGSNSRGVGGVLTIDGVLQPYQPGWFYRWGWIALSSFLLGLVLAGVGYGAWAWWHKDGRIRLPEALEGEEE